jgi:predicted  nucleic acid-binding Zn-ribbon protein
LAKASKSDSYAALEAECLQLRRERDDLAQQLAAANARNHALEAKQKDVVNRIDWVLDSIHNLVDS